MADSFAGFNSFRLRQLTGIPLKRICEVACEIAYDTLVENPLLLRDIIEKYSIRPPERQLEIDLRRGYEKVVPVECIGDYLSRIKDRSSQYAENGKMRPKPET